MARSTYFYSIHQRCDKYSDIRRKILSIYQENKGRYGYRRVYLELRTRGVVINHKTVARLMNEMGLKGVRKTRHYKSYMGDVGKLAPNIIQRDFEASGPNQKWTTDVTQICIKDRKCYLSPILDMWNGEIISYTISNRPDLKMVTQMLKRAFKQHPNLRGLIMHSDQGWHYQHRDYQTLLSSHGILQSMSRKGNCLDNSIMENFFSLMKNELLYVNQFDSIENFKRELINYIRYYNNNRIKLRLGTSPTLYRQRELNKQL